MTLYEADSKSDCDRVRALLADRAATLLHKAVMKEDLKRLHWFLLLDADIHKKDAHECTLLHKASGRGLYDNKEVVRVLLDAGADVEDTDENGDTPLHKASHWANTNVARLLLERGANIFARDKNGDTPLHRVFPFQYQNVLLSLVCSAVLTVMPRGGDESVSEIVEDKVDQAMKLLKVVNPRGIFNGEVIKNEEGYLEKVRDPELKLPEDLLCKKAKDLLSKERDLLSKEKRYSSIKKAILEVFKDKLRRDIKARVQEHVSTQDSTFEVRELEQASV